MRWLSLLVLLGFWSSFARTEERKPRGYSSADAFLALLSCSTSLTENAPRDYRRPVVSVTAPSDQADALNALWVAEPPFSEVLSREVEVRFYRERKATEEVRQQVWDRALLSFQKSSVYSTVFDLLTFYELKASKQKSRSSVRDRQPDSLLGPTDGFAVGDSSRLIRSPAYFPAESPLSAESDAEPLGLDELVQAVREFLRQTEVRGPIDVVWARVRPGTARPISSEEAAFASDVLTRLKEEFLGNRFRFKFAVISAHDPKNLVFVKLFD